MKDKNGVTFASPLAEKQSPPPVHLSLQELLETVELLDYHDALKNVLKLRHAGDIGDVEQNDLDGIGMSRPEQRRLFREYHKHFGRTEEKRFGLKKLRQKVFGRETVKAHIEKEEQLKQSVKSTECKKTDSDKQQQQHHHHIIPTDKITLCKEIGSGEFGCVFQAAWHNSEKDGLAESTQVAVKRILPEKLITQHSNFLQEAAIMTKMQHENVIRLYGVVLDTKAVMLVSELAPCGSLLECLQCPGWREPFSVSALCDFALQIARGMNYLAAQRLIHRDLAARNVLVCSPTKVKISDFGLSRSLGHGEDYYRSEFNPTMKLPIAWCAPECINFLRFTSASDVWAYAVCLWEMFSFGKTPWEGMTGSQILHTVDTQRKTLACPEACPREIYSELMLKCWQWEAERRPSFEQICAEHLPALMPPMLVSVQESGRTTRRGHLQYGRDETIVLLDKNPPSGNGLWLGASKTGKVGLFRAEDTIAYLGAENPSASTSSGNLSVQLPDNEAKRKAKEKKEKKSKEERREERKRAAESEEKEMRKLLISQPQGDLRHTCHVGADGRSFGLLNIDKNELARALPPKISPNHSPPLAPEESRILSGCDNSAAEGPVSPLLSMSMISLTPPRPPKRDNRTDLMSKSVCLGNYEGLERTLTLDQTPLADHANNSSSTNVPPALPPKPPRFRPREYANNLANSGQQQSPSTPPTTQFPVLFPSAPTASSTLTQKSDHSEVEATCRGSPQFPLESEEKKQRRTGTATTVCPSPAADETQLREKSTNKSDEEEEEEHFLRPISICCDPVIGDKESTETEDKVLGKDAEEERILQILTELQKDLSEFSLSSLEDCSDGRALLDGERRREEEIAEREMRKTEELCAALAEQGVMNTSTAIGMERDEFERMAEEEQKKVVKRLKKEEEDGEEQQKRNSVVLAISSLLKGKEEEDKRCREEEEELFASCSTSQNGSVRSNGLLSLLPRSNKPPLEDWTPEAHEAYKLLVQCGHSLKGTSMSPTDGSSNRRSTPSPGSAKSVAISISNPVAKMGSVQVEMASVEQPKKIEYINPLLAEKSNGEVQDSDAANGKTPTRRHNGATPNNDWAGIRLPPPVPPKPKIKINITASDCCIHTREIK